MARQDGDSATARAAEVRWGVFRLARRLRAERPANALSPSRALVLWHLYSKGPTTPGDLAAAEHQRPQSLTRVFADLARAGLIAKARSTADRRQYVISLTQAGRDVLQREMARRDAWLAAAMEGLTETERQVLVMSAALMERLAAHPARPKTRARGARRAVAAAAIASTLLGGCATDWDKPGFDLSVAPAYRARPGGAEAPRVPDRWAATFGSRELADLADIALTENLDIQGAIARIAQADAQARIASAPLSPQIGFAGAASRTQTPGTVLSQTGPFTSSRRNFFNLGLNASYEVDFWGRNADTSAAARLAAEATRFDRAVIALSTVGSLANTYLQMLGAQDRLRVARENVRLAGEVLDAVAKRVQLGTGTALDQAQQETVLATQRASIPPLEQVVQQARNVVAVLVGRTPESLIVKGGSLDALRVPAVRPGLPSQLLLRRPDVAEAQFRVLSQDLSTEAARAAFFPQVTLTGAASVQSIVLRNLLRPEAIAYQVASQLVQPLIDGNLLQGQYSLQKGRYAEALAAYHKQILTAFADVENALVAVAQTSAQERLQVQATAAARRAYDIGIRRLQEGTIDIVTLSTIQLQLFANQNLLSQVRLSRFLAAVQLYQALGGGWDDVKRELAVIEEARVFEFNRSLGP